MAAVARGRRFVAVFVLRLLVVGGGGGGVVVVVVVPPPSDAVEEGPRRRVPVQRWRSTRRPM